MATLICCLSFIQQLKADVKIEDEQNIFLAGNHWPQ